MIHEPDRLETRPSPLSYADPRLNQDDRERRSGGASGQGLRRMGFGFGLGLIMLGFGLAEYSHREEVQFCLAVGGFLFGAAIPSIPPRRGIES